MSELAARHASDPADQFDLEDEELEADTDPPLAARFGPAITLDALAQGDVTRYAAVLASDAETMLLKLTMLAATAAYQRRLQKLYHAKKE